MTEEPHIATRAGIRKPDLVAAKDNRVCVIDSQVVSGQQPLGDAHRRKVAKYAEDLDVCCAVRSWRGKYRDKVEFSTCTVSWRGIWSSASTDFLMGLGMSRRLLGGITTRIMQGSHTNWTRWNKMTTTGGRRERAGIG